MYVLVCKEEDSKRKKREERLKIIKNNVELKYAIKRKVSDGIFKMFGNRKILTVTLLFN